MSLNNFIKLIHWFLITLLVAFISWLFWQQFVPSGRLVIQYSFSKKSSLISDLYPEIRLSPIFKDKEGNTYQKIIIDPVYFDLQMPRMFKKADLKIIYQNSKQPIFEIGAKAQERGWQWQFKPLENQIIDKIPWLCLREGEVILCQREREREYLKISDFFAHPPEGKIATYNCTLPSNFSKSQVVPLNIKTDLKNFSFIIASYKPPKEESGWKIARASFDLGSLYIKENKLQFILSAPFLDQKLAEIKLKEIEITLEKEPITGVNFIPRLKNWFKRYVS